MLVMKKNHMYSNKRKFVYGSGFMDSLRGIGSYVLQNKDLIAKPLLGAVGNIGALALTEGSKAIMNRIINKAHNSAPKNNLEKLDPESIKILQNIVQSSGNPVSNILGSGIKEF